MEPFKHQPSNDHPEWNESYYFIFEDKNSKLKGMSRLGIKPNKGEGQSFFFLFLPDGSAAASFNTVDLHHHVESVGGIGHHPHDDHWEYRFEGKMIQVDNPELVARAQQDPSVIRSILDIEISFSFHPISEVYEYSKYMTEESRELGKKAGDMHWEQIGLSSGRIKVHDTEYVISQAMSQRDHTYGIRDWTGIGNWLYYVIWFNKNLAINPAAIIASDGKMSTGGFIFKDGKNVPLKSIRIVDQQFREDGIYPVSSHLLIHDIQDNKYELKGFVNSLIPVPFKDEGGISILIQAFGDFELNGISGGYGSFETLRKIPTIQPNN
ncbi:MAG: hypothetical protein INQ03_01515 [Candidatus Heimdallarchaeota archaeon]|nr:hypothetical protein [Candidatus Heimdallarchaeota archaeon]